MSAWRVGTDSVGPTADAPDAGRPHGLPDDAQSYDVPGAEPAGPPTPPAGNATVIDALNGVTKWIPGDVLALYVTAVTAFAAADDAQPSPVLLIIFVGLSAAFVIAGVFAKTSTVPNSAIAPALLAAIAFLIWSVSVPFSGWQRWSVIGDNQAPAAVIAAIVGLLFGLVAEGLTRERRPSVR